MKKYPRIDHYYSSAVPTTQGLNATFRSQLVYDKDLPGERQPSLFRILQQAGFEGYFINASSRYYANEYREYPAQFGMEHYLAKEDLGNMGYKGASGWGFHNDVMYDVALKTLAENRDKKLFLVCKTLDMHQPILITATPMRRCRRMSGTTGPPPSAACTGWTRPSSTSLKRHPDRA